MDDSISIYKIIEPHQTTKKILPHIEKIGQFGQQNHPIKTLINLTESLTKKKSEKDTYLLGITTHGHAKLWRIEGDFKQLARGEPINVASQNLTDTVFSDVVFASGFSHFSEFDTPPIGSFYTVTFFLIFFIYHKRYYYNFYLFCFF